MYSVCNCSNNNLVKQSFGTNNYLHLDEESQQNFQRAGKNYDAEWSYKGRIWVPPGVNFRDITEEDIDKAIKFFERLMTGYRGLRGILRARPVGERRRPGNPIFNTASRWTYNYLNYKYVKQPNVLTPNTRLRRMYNFLDRNVTFAHNVTEGFLLGTRTAERWHRDMSTGIKWSNLASFLFGIGGKNTIDPDDASMISQIIKSQLHFFEEFASATINNPETFDGGKGQSNRQVLNRARMYAEAPTFSYEVGSAEAADLPLPEYPADGQQICLTNCRCHWDIDEDSDPEFILCTWSLDPGAEHCNSCIENNAKWNPYRIRKPDPPEEPKTGVIQTVKSIYNTVVKIIQVYKNIKEILRQLSVAFPSQAQAVNDLINRGRQSARYRGFKTNMISRMLVFRDRLFNNRTPGSHINPLRFEEYVDELSQYNEAFQRALPVPPEPEVVPFDPQLERGDPEPIQINGVWSWPDHPDVPEYLRGRPIRRVARNEFNVDERRFARQYMTQRTNNIRRLIDVLKRIRDQRNLQDALESDSEEYVIEEIKREINKATNLMIIIFLKLEETTKVQAARDDEENQ